MTKFITEAPIPVIQRGTAQIPQSGTPVSTYGTTIPGSTGTWVDCYPGPRPPRRRPPRKSRWSPSNLVVHHRVIEPAVEAPNRWIDPGSIA